MDRHYVSSQPCYAMDNELSGGRMHDSRDIADGQGVRRNRRNSEDVAVPDKRRHTESPRQEAERAAFLEDGSRQTGESSG
jgi:hypothetical protein